MIAGSDYVVGVESEVIKAITGSSAGTDLVGAVSTCSWLATASVVSRTCLGAVREGKDGLTGKVAVWREQVSEEKGWHKR